MLPLINNADRDIKLILLKNFRQKKKVFYPKGEYRADIDNLIKCMLCPNMCRFDRLKLKFHSEIAAFFKRPKLKL